MIHDPDLLSRNIHLLLKYYGFLPEQYIDRFRIKKNLMDIYDIFDGKVLPNKTNLNRISRLLNLSIYNLAHIHNDIPMIFRHTLKRWHMSLATFVNAHYNSRGKSKARAISRIKIICKHSIYKDATYTRQQAKFLADILGITSLNVRSLSSVKFYYHPTKEYCNQYPRIRQFMLLHLKNVRSAIQLVAWHLNASHPRNDYYSLKYLYLTLKELAKMCRIASDMTSAIKVKSCMNIFHNIRIYIPSKVGADKVRAQNYNSLIRFDKIMKQIMSRYSLSSDYNHARSQKFTIIAAIQADNLTQQSKVNYIVYGSHSERFHKYINKSLRTYYVTTPGLAALDPGWRKLLYADGMGDYFHTIGSYHHTNKYIKDCTLTKLDVRKIVKYLNSQGLTYAKILPCNNIDWWLNHHNVEYREKGNEEL